MATSEHTLTGGWDAIAGTGYCTITSPHSIRWAVGATTPSASLSGHVIPAGTDRSFNLEAGEILYVRGRAIGIVTYTRENAPA